MSSSKTRISALTFVSISLVILVIGFGGVHYSVTNIRTEYVELQLELNKRTAETVSKLLSSQIDKGTSKEKILDNFQKAIVGSHINEGYLCMFDQQTAELLCHPNSEMIGVKVNHPRFKFESITDDSEQILGNAVQSGGAESGILRLQDPERSEITYMVPVEGTSWKVSVHENIEKTEQNLMKMRYSAYIGFIILALLISILATYVARKISASYEKKIEAQNLELEKQNEMIHKQKATIEEYASNLEDKVKERTIELEKANNKLRHLEKAKSDFLGIISHELRTPLNGIIGFSDILEYELKDTEHYDSVQNIKISGERLMKFSETALLITELTSQNTKLDFEKKLIRDIFEQSKKEFKKELNEKNITLHETYPEKPVLLPLVEELMQQCFYNIMKNAIRFTPENGDIFVEFKKEGENFVCDFRDTGTGFSDEALSKLFDYFGADKVMNHKEGFGLGLSASSLIMEAHSGSIEVKNCSGEFGAQVLLVFNNVFSA